MKLSYILCVLFALLSFASPALAAPTVMATLNGATITEEEVETMASDLLVKRLTARMSALDMYEYKRDAIDEIITNRLLTAEAKKQGLTVEKLKNKAVKEAGTATESEAQTIYAMQKNRYKGKTFDEVKLQIMAQMTAQKKNMAIQDLVETLKKKAKIAINLEKPRQKVSTDDDPSQGGDKNAPIILIEFSEYQCPYCKRVRPTIKQILETYANKVHYVFRDFPLSFHAQAKDAANAAECADDQGKYWEFADQLWDSQGQQTKEQLTKIAEGLKLDMDSFNSCVETNKYYDEIDKDQQDGMKAGASGTPAYFINGIFLSGAQPFESFKEIIDDELNIKK